MNNKVKEINVLEELFSENNIKYVIPLYQRAFAWKDTEIYQLIEDIEDIDENTKNYFLGSLIVAKNKGHFEVIDGQQRLTALYLLFNVLGINTKKIISFDCREKSNYTLKHINEDKIDIKRIEKSIFDGKKAIEEEFVKRENKDKDFKNKFKTKLSKVKLYRIEVPQKTDLNRYFEIMNTRGEQLEQQDILKAYLMSNIINDKDRQIFATIWDACSDMNGYLQMHFNTTYRDILFDDNWEAIPKLKKLDTEQIEDVKIEENTIKEIINSRKEQIDNDNVIEDKEGKIRFEGTINFPYFLLHALRVFVKQKGIMPKNKEDKIFDKLLDDKQLVKDFKNVIENCDWSSKYHDKNDFVMDFIDFLMQLRFLFDKYIIKREFANDDQKGEWSLKELKVSSSGKNKKAYFNDTNNNNHSKILMLQSCYRVSYTSSKIMHWITELLNWLYTEKENLTYSTEEYLIITEEIAKKACQDFLAVGDYNLGINTPHIVFNYLDYLLWNKNKYEEDFIFEFRNSVEHWYPQHPSKGTFDGWKHEEGLDNFGNLCLIQREINANFSNLAPSGKKDSFKETINKGSLKLREMARKTVKTKGKDADKYWKEEAYLLHGKEMIDLLKKACDII